MRIATLVMAVLLATVIVANAQDVPNIGVYFDQYLSKMSSNGWDGQPATQMDTWYVVGNNFNCWVAGAEFKIDYPGVVMWMSDAGTPPVTIGNTSTGISMGFGLPVNGFTPFVICQVNVLWLTPGCPQQNIPVPVVQHPYTFYLGGTDFPDYNLVPAVGMTSLICPSVPTEDTTWGGVKALYE